MKSAKSTVQIAFKKLELSTLISGWIKKYRWIAWLGLLAILVVAVELIYTDIKILFL